MPQKRDAACRTKRSRMGASRVRLSSLIQLKQLHDDRDPFAICRKGDRGPTFGTNVEGLPPPSLPEALCATNFAVGTHSEPPAGVGVVRGWVGGLREPTLKADPDPVRPHKTFARASFGTRFAPWGCSRRALCTRGV
jgi:hypothetical protein